MLWQSKEHENQKVAISIGQEEFLQKHKFITYFYFNPLLNDKILDINKLKASADNKLNVAKMAISLFDSQKTLWEKEKMLVNSIFSFTLSVFKRLLYGL